MMTPRHAIRLIVGSLLFFLMRSLRLFLFFNSSSLLSIPLKSFILEIMRTSKKVPVTLPGLLLFFLVLSLSFNIIFAICQWRRDTVVYVVDGDTFTLADGRRVRLLGLDAPEIGRCMSEEAKNRLSQLVLGKHVRLKDVGYHDDYGRILASVIAFRLFDHNNLAMINRVMVEEGLGLYHNSGGQYAEVLRVASQVARTGKLGIYSDICTPKVPPQTGCTIKGNIRDGKKTYFLSSCYNYSDVVVSTSFGDSWFCSEAEAQKNEFVKSPTCK